MYPQKSLSGAPADVQNVEAQSFILDLLLLGVKCREAEINRPRIRVSLSRKQPQRSLYLW